MEHTTDTFVMMTLATVCTLAGVSSAIADTVLGDARSVDGQMMVAPIQIDGDAFTLRLRKHSVRAPGFFVRVYGDDGSYRDCVPESISTYRGDVIDDRTGRSVGPCVASISNGKTRSALVPHPASPTTRMRVERDQPIAIDIVPFLDHTCTTVEVGGQPVEPSPVVTARTDDRRSVYETEIAFDIQYQYFELFGSVDAVVEHVEDILNSVTLQYESQLDISYVLTAIVVRTAEPDPYPDNALIPRLIEEWETNQADVPRDVATLLMTTHPTSFGAAAAIGAICRDTGLAYNSVRYNPNHGILIGVLEHELGHNWNANHCGCGGTMAGNGAQHQTGAFGQPSIDEIIPFRDTQPCLDVVQRPVIPRLMPPFNEDFEAAAIDPTNWALSEGSNVVQDDSANWMVRLQDGGLLQTQSIDTDGSWRIFLSYRWKSGEGATDDTQLGVEYLSRAYLWEPIAIHHDAAASGDWQEVAFELPGESANGGFPAFSPDLRLRYTANGPGDVFVDDISLTIVRHNPCPEDCAGADGVVDISDLMHAVHFFQGTGDDPTCDPVPKYPDGSFGNGETNIDDLLAVIYAFGPCEAAE